MRAPNYKMKQCNDQRMKGISSKENKQAQHKGLFQEPGDDFNEWLCELESQRWTTVHGKACKLQKLSIISTRLFLLSYQFDDLDEHPIVGGSCH